MSMASSLWRGRSAQRVVPPQAHRLPVARLFGLTAQVWPERDSHRRRGGGREAQGDAGRRALHRVEEAGGGRIARPAQVAPGALHMVALVCELEGVEVAAA